LNRAVTKKFVAENGIVTLKVDKTDAAPEGDELLVRLGNKNKQIPFIAIFPAGSPNKPILLDGVFASPAPIIEALKQAGPSRTAQDLGKLEPPETARRGSPVRQ
jgi:hypothetical protein